LIPFFEALALKEKIKGRKFFLNEDTTIFNVKEQHKYKWLGAILERTGFTNR
jgi:predicted ABC-type sugar transport system permease subunit